MFRFHIFGIFMVIFATVIICFPLKLSAQAEAGVGSSQKEPKAEFMDLKSIKMAVTKEHKGDVKKELKGTRGSYDIDLETNSFSSDTRIGVTNMTGNTQSIAINGTSDTRYRVKRVENSWHAGAFYSHVFSSSTNAALGTSVRYIYGSYRLDYYLTNRFTVFGGGGGYTDELKGIELAGQGFAGVRYYLLMSPSYYFSTSLGYNYTYEDVLPPDRNRHINSAALMLDYEHDIRDNLKLEEHVEVLENVQDGRDIRINSDTSLRVSFTKHLGIALGFLIRFDNQPPAGFKKLDTITSVSLAIVF